MDEFNAGKFRGAVFQMNFLASESRKIQARGTGDNSMAGSFRSDLRGKSSGIMTKDSMLLGQKFVVKNQERNTNL